MIEMMALRIATHIKHAVPDHPASTQVLKFVLAAILNTVFIITLTLTVSLFTGKLIEVVIIMVAFAFLRQMTGGLHLKSGMGCVVVSTLLFTGLSFVHLDYKWTMGATIASTLLILVFAPAGIENQTRIPPKYFPLLKVAALILVGFNLWFANPITAVSFLTQTLLLINIRR
ncbi:accessory gene regulator ArgB-like protein [Paenibacillus sp. 23TSA30-6]|uniref:accessory gene regulator ArgB-like protein n=1 Tax=Paenibacillus sp. 23TSA30-6 TaxID=2546104 RepID=UPI001787A69A|nr:accessory gene regulator B family protein [Paenibacillus sp. 23TSA30-6]MBE0335135.1 accessory regulator AgrB [Paenibacillus sp. 23TSA30-6]